MKLLERGMPQRSAVHFACPLVPEEIAPLRNFSNLPPSTTALSRYGRAGTVDRDQTGRVTDKTCAPLYRSVKSRSEQASLPADIAQR